MEIYVIILFAAVAGIYGNVIPENGVLANTGLEVIFRKPFPVDVTLDDRLNCSGGQPDGVQPINRVDTSVRVENFILGMANANYDAYIVPTEDAHQSEYTAPADERRKYISGFDGSAGTAVILADGQRALWTDGRYFLHADDQLDCNWLFMRSGQEGVPTIPEWLISTLQPGSVVSADARLIGADTWIALENSLAANGISLVVDEIIDGNSLLDDQWNLDGRPPYSQDPIFHLSVEYSGRIWQEKIADVELKMDEYGADVFVLTALDETAWQLNLRGSDIPYNPVFRSYIIIDKSESGPSKVSLFVPDIATKVPQQVLDVLNIDNCQPSQPCVSLLPYDQIGNALTVLAAQSTVSKVMIPGAFSTSSGSSYYIYNLIPDEKRLLKPSPALLMKAAKNEVERQNIKNAHVKDAVALIEYLSFMEKEITTGQTWDELSAQDVLAEYRYAQKDNMGLSFDTISAFGPNAAIIHYSATSETTVPITDQNLYLVDSGGQYLDGTTDVTRTVHFGTPTDYQIECYTRVLMGVIDFASINIPKGTGKSYTDVLARRALYNVGLNYRHGTSHGVGMFLNVHEGSDTVYELGFHGSDEPGYYQDGEFGIRIENVITTVDVTTKYNFTEVSYGFETITVVPYEPKLIDITMLTREQCEFLNEYNLKIRNVAGPALLDQAKTDAYNWMLTKTNPYTCV